MLNIILDFIPIALFFMAFKFYGIYVATVVGIVATALQVIVHYIRKRYFDRQQLITLVVFVFFGGMTLYFHNPLFVKWKPTVIFWIFGIILFCSQFIGKKPLMQRMMEGALDKSNTVIPANVWKKINISWMVFFIFLGSLNLYVAYNYSTDAWVNFKLYGTLSMLVIFSFLQAIFLSKYASESK